MNDIIAPILILASIIYYVTHKERFIDTNSFTGQLIRTFGLVESLKNDYKIRFSYTYVLNFLLFVFFLFIFIIIRLFLDAKVNDESAIIRIFLRQNYVTFKNRKRNILVNSVERASEY